MMRATHPARYPAAAVLNAILTSESAMRKGSHSRGSFFTLVAFACDTCVRLEETYTRQALVVDTVEEPSENRQPAHLPHTHQESVSYQGLCLGARSIARASPTAAELRKRVSRKPRIAAILEDV